MDGGIDVDPAGEPAPEVAGVQAQQARRRLGHDGGGARHVRHQRGLAEVVAGAERGEPLLVLVGGDPHDPDLAVQEHVEAVAARPLPDDELPGLDRLRCRRYEATCRSSERGTSARNGRAASASRCSRGTWPRACRQRRSSQQHDRQQRPAEHRHDREGGRPEQHHAHADRHQLTAGIWPTPELREGAGVAKIARLQDQDRDQHHQQRVAEAVRRVDALLAGERGPRPQPRQQALADERQRVGPQGRHLQVVDQQEVAVKLQDRQQVEDAVDQPDERRLEEERAHLGAVQRVGQQGERAAEHQHRERPGERDGHPRAPVRHPDVRGLDEHQRAGSSTAGGRPR